MSAGVIRMRLESVAGDSSLDCRGLVRTVAAAGLRGEDGGEHAEEMDGDASPGTLSSGEALWSAKRRGSYVSGGKEGNRRGPSARSKPSQGEEARATGDQCQRCGAGSESSARSGLRGMCCVESDGGGPRASWSGHPRRWHLHRTKGSICRKPQKGKSWQLPDKEA